MTINTFMTIYYSGNNKLLTTTSEILMGLAI
jgi:hypothetical protein